VAASVRAGEPGDAERHAECHQEDLDGQSHPASLYQVLVDGGDKAGPQHPRAQQPGQDDGDAATTRVRRSRIGI